LGIIDYPHHRHCVSGIGDEVEDGEANQEATCRLTRLQPERSGERVALRLDQPVQVAEKRFAELEKPCERHLHLGLDAGPSDDSTIDSASNKAIQQGGLAHAGLAPEHEYTTTARAADLGQQFVECRALLGTAAKVRVGLLHSHGGDHFAVDLCDSTTRSAPRGAEAAPYTLVRECLGRDQRDDTDVIEDGVAYLVRVMSRP
jgi:hypothetical protein